MVQFILSPSIHRKSPHKVTNRTIQIKYLRLKNKILTMNIPFDLFPSSMKLRAQKLHKYNTINILCTMNSLFNVL